MGFGGKFCIDGTFKFEEEIEDQYLNYPAPKALPVDDIQQEFPEIASLNDSLLKLDIPCLIVSVQKNRRAHVAELHNAICSGNYINGVKMILYVEHTVNALDLPTALWRFCNNLDPKRDHFLFKKETEEGKYNAILGLDGTIKTKEFDGFERDWPNIIVADDKTIASIDAKWNDLGIGKFIPSPSLKYKDQMYGDQAVASPK
ncbi:UbiD family decarboxylase [Niabella ginsengisoli]|uniref:UbiD family decarboxylase n=1 Tax=Niabella ginsengisoli TaxID=522298 RepID=A0ABS9SJL4_9BACT|nr:UbiD family decarboxylase domain-containing protein [Niabella ginsengisoli]MCH5598572.1 UbiD family decarboxylase [Niabella ginsengisoli]